MSWDLKGWLEELAKKGSLSAEDKELLESKLKPAEQELRDSFLRQSDYSRKMQELQTERQKDKEYIDRLTEWEREQKLRYESVAGKAALADEYEKQLKQLKDTYGDALPEVQLKEMARQQSQGVSEDALKGYLRQDEAQKALMDSFRAQTLLLKLDKQHAKIFGGGIEDPDALVDYALQSGKQLEEAWRERYNVGAKEAEMREADVQRRIDEAIAREKESWLNTQAMPGLTPGQAVSGSPFFDVIKPENNQHNQTLQRMERIGAAAADYRSQQK